MGDQIVKFFARIRVLRQLRGTSLSDGAMGTKAGSQFASFENPAVL